MFRVLILVTAVALAGCTVSTRTESAKRQSPKYEEKLPTAYIQDRLFGIKVLSRDGKVSPEEEFQKCGIPLCGKIENEETYRKLRELIVRTQKPWLTVDFSRDMLIVVAVPRARDVRIDKILLDDSKKTMTVRGSITILETETATASWFAYEIVRVKKSALPAEFAWDKNFVKRADPLDYWIESDLKTLREKESK
jgi:hypothetical protein